MPEHNSKHDLRLAKRSYFPSPPFLFSLGDVNRQIPIGDKMKSQIEEFPVEIAKLAINQIEDFGDLDRVMTHLDARIKEVLPKKE